MRILVRLALLCPYLPAPPISGGRIRILELARGLAEEHEVAVFSSAPEQELQNPYAQASLAAFSKVYAVPRTRLWFRFSNLPRRVIRNPTLQAVLRQEHAKAPFDLAVVEHSHTAKLALDAGLQFVVDEHNIESDYQRAYDTALKQPGRRERRQHTLLRVWERKVWQRAEAVVCVSKADAAVVRSEAPSTPVSIVPNGAALQGISFRLPSQRASRTVLFVGLMSFPPNVAAARILAEEVMPRVWRDYPEAKLVLCGHDPVPEVRRFSGARVQVTGTVSSVRPFLDEAAVIVNPVRHGAGTSLKVLEALASGAPLVTTKVGVRGYDAEIAAACLIANTTDECAKAITRCLEGPGDDERARRGRAAAAEYDWTKLSARFSTAVGAVLTKART